MAFYNINRISEIAVDKSVKREKRNILYLLIFISIPFREKEIAIRRIKV